MKNFFLVFLIFSLASCGKKSSNSHKPERIIDPVHVRTLEITQKETVNFHRKEQMTSRYNCKNELVSRKLETLNSLSSKLLINYENRKKAWSYSVYNRRTKSSNKGAFTKNGNFVVDYAPTVFNMKVKNGINDVEYVFNKCTKIQENSQGEKKCVGTVELEKEGMIQIDVYYSAETVPGETHIYPTPESCKPTNH